MAKDKLGELVPEIETKKSKSFFETRLYVMFFVRF